MTAEESRYEALAAELESLAKEAPNVLLENEPLRKRILNASTAVIPAIETQADFVQRLVYSPLEIMAARIGHNMGLFKKLVDAKRPLTTKEVSESLGGDPRVVERLIKFMASLQYVTEVDVGTWGPSRMTSMLAEPGVEGGVHVISVTLGPSWGALPGWLERTKYQSTGDANDTAFSSVRGGNNVFQFLHDHPKHFEHFGRFMTVQRFDQDLWLARFPFAETVSTGADSTKPLFVDVAGGVGHQCQNCRHLIMNIQALLKKFPDFAGRVILQDQAEALADALPVEGMKTQAIDFFKTQPVQGARAYYLRSVLHDWPDKDCRTILRHLRAASSSQSMLLLDEMVIPDKGAHKIAMQMDMVMLANLCSEERSESRWKDLLATEGFKVASIHTYSSEVGNSIVVAIPV